LGAMEKLKDHWVISFVGLVSALVGMYPVIQNLAPDQVDRPAAGAYLHEWFRTATGDDPSKAYDELDHPSQTRLQFATTYSKIDTVKLSSVRSDDGGFTTWVTYCWKNGDIRSRNQTFTLVCSKWSELPLVGCGDIRIHDIVTNKHHSGNYC
jgi:hypothetical protein